MKQIALTLTALIFAAALLAAPTAAQSVPVPGTVPPPSKPRAYLPMTAKRAALIQDPPGYFTPAPPDAR